MVTLLDLQVQVQTRFGLSRIATAAFAQCGQKCQNGGECWWSKDIAYVECVCPELYYGDWCQNGSLPPPIPAFSRRPSTLASHQLELHVVCVCRVCVCRVYEG
jgi:hypothetical protein